MPRQLQNKIKSALARPPRYHKGVYEKRAMINGIEIYGCATDVNDCEQAFIEDLSHKISAFRRADGTHQPAQPKKPVLFKDFAPLWFEEVFRPNVTKEYYDKEILKYRNYIEPFFGKMRICDIKPLDCVRFFNQIQRKGLGRTAESCYGSMKRILQFAIDSDIIVKHPMASMKPIKHERKNGCPLSKEEEKLFLQKIAGSKLEGVFLVALYTGLRPCEYSSARLEGEFVVARNRKQKNVNKVVYKKIPITPMLAKHLPTIEVAMGEWAQLTKDTHNIGRFFNRYCEGHRLYDLRTTFATRAQECGVSEQAVQMWMGHAPRTLLGQVYTKLPDEYLLKEGKKVLY